MADIRIGPATEADLVAINAIYNHYVLHSTATYQTEECPFDERLSWFHKHGPSHPINVAESSAGHVIGWGSLSPFHVRAAYRNTVEDSIYIHHDYHRRGIGKALLTDLIAQARKIGHHTILGVISADQTTSIRLHESLGFVNAGAIREVGHKFGRWLDVAYLQLML